MSIDELVKKYWCTNFLQRDLRAALTEQAEAYEAVAKVTKMNSDRLLHKANERIRDLQLELLANGEAQRVPIAKVSMFAGPESNGVEWLIPHMQRERMEGKLLTAAPAPKEGK